MVSDIALLGFLHSEQLHGYEIYQRFTNLPGLWEIWRIKQSRLYAMLARLEAKGLIQSKILYQENRPARKVFHISENGQAAYKTWVIQPVANGREFRLEFLVKVFFAIHEGPKMKNQLVDAQIDTCNTWLIEARQALEVLEDGQSFEKLIHYFRVGQVVAMLEWLSSIDAFDNPQVSV